MSKATRIVLLAIVVSLSIAVGYYAAIGITSVMREGAIFGIMAAGLWCGLSGFCTWAMIVDVFIDEEWEQNRRN